MTTYTIHVVGESFENEDGSSRQAELRHCRVGEAVSLVRDPKNRYDSNCVKVISPRGVQIGNIGRDNAVWIAQRMDRDGHVSATISSIGMVEGAKLGAVLAVSTDWDGIDPDYEGDPP